MCRICEGEAQFKETAAIGYEPSRYDPDHSGSHLQGMGDCFSRWAIWLQPGLC